MDDRPFGSPWVDISLDALTGNLAAIRSKISDPSKLIAVVKDNAYGCGAVPIARALQNNGVQFFAVARIAEAKELRATGITAPILIMGKVSESDLIWASGHQVRVVIYDLEDITAFASAPAPLTVHLKLDTGMGRLGLQQSELVIAAGILTQNPALSLEGVFTHFACADDPDPAAWQTQRTRFSRMMDILHEYGLSWSMTHTSNSAATLHYGVDKGEWARTGIALYGCSPDPAQIFTPATEEILSFKSHIVKIKIVAAGTPISYGWNWRAQRESRIATIPLGYANGFPRGLSGKGFVLIHGVRCPIAGNVTMDYIMVDITDVPEAVVGSIVTAIGRDGEEQITADDIARLTGTIGYEVITRIPDRVQRFFC